ncbi:D-alanyl-D-alanine carboxypeptidase/D-alanyl-D-alanine endopeptidase [Planococcus ruber]|uniref:D-alanyl-D-alanine carboxypeptidase/D-alanyl-D-alanine endopeptidase n=1 Tax=Planococcus ruber TaxID=2027871 RepID=UPI001FEECDB1|nr:D-alanyl-D-alanine carboxypeptidase/D-alanyl-D-alanine-endopeptidase [Planococcus ruber]MCJ1907910.1 D-alanyl-D-alanine carboxypeptidase/D-alanyl-D-alanine-endopeptidase [Planococcus ruber]
MKIKQKMMVGMVAFTMFFSGAAFTAPSADAASPYSSLQSSAASVLNDSRLKGVTHSVTVQNATTGEVVFEKNSNQLVTPASTLKTLTAAAALETLGENHRFTTQVLTNGSVAKGTLYGNLYLRGQGDPTLLKKDFDAFASILSKRGVQRLSGHLIGDDTWYDADRLSPGISKEDESYYYAAQISALSLAPNTDYDTGSVIVHAKASSQGKPAKVTLTPATNVVQIINKSKTVAKGSRNTLKIERQYGTKKVIITGNAPIGNDGTKEWIAVSNPTAYALDVFKKSLSEKGIRFVATSKTVSGKTPANARVLLTKNSMPLKQLMVPFLKLSNNTHAEVLAKEMGKQVYGDGSWDSGLKVMRDYGASIGLDMSKWKFEDASGMSHANKTTSKELSKLLIHVRSEPWYKSYLNGLPVAGAKERFVGGTLRQRLTTGAAKGNVIAKTGSLNNVSALSGYVKTKDGEWLTYSILTQNTKSSTVPVIDRLASTIANSKKTK